MPLPPPVVYDGLAWVKTVTIAGTGHDRTITGGGAASVKPKQFGAVNTLPGDLKTAISGTYHSFDVGRSFAM